MIAHLEGIVFHKDLLYLVLETGGVGYRVYATPEVLGEARVGASYALWTHYAAKEETTELYGFRTKEELDFFGLLLGVSGIGPKSALAILSLAPVETLAKAIAADDTAYLTKVSGIGKKTAAKIVLELKEKVAAAEEEGTALGRRETGDALEALAALGYPLKDARDALRSVGETARGTNEKIKEALKLLSR
ncbi:MAG: Holliday junction branch migration protein RuvA [Parcubacteria group bacterium]|nr:Holliday junction branch migration protein RuvA [Parcubacteria group bacterium]